MLCRCLGTGFKFPFLIQSNHIPLVLSVERKGASHVEQVKGRVC
jgi:hypothetical protein